MFLIRKHLRINTNTHNKHYSIIDNNQNESYSCPKVGRHLTCPDLSLTYICKNTSFLYNYAKLYLLVLLPNLLGNFRICPLLLLT